MDDEGELAGYRDSDTRVSEVADRLAAFNEAREWGPFHTPRDLAMCVAIEAGELLEAFLWKGERAEPDLDKVREELADVVISVVNLARALDVDVMAAVDAKIVRNGQRYPVDLARGRADKHDQLGRVDAEADAT